MSKKWDAFKDDQNILYILYNEANYSFEDLADYFDVSKSAVYYKFKEHGIKTRDTNERKTHSVPLNGKELYRLYVKEDYNMSDISRFYDVAHSTISRKLEDYNFKERKKRNETSEERDTDNNEN